MNYGATFAKGLGNGPVFGWARIFPNGTSTPALTSVTGPLKQWISSLSYSATGIINVVFRDGFNLNEMNFGLSVQSVDAASAFTASQIGAYNTTTRTFSFLTVAGGAASAITANANNSVLLVCYAQYTPTSS